jgi:hypothetical protein
MNFKHSVVKMLFACIALTGILTVSCKKSFDEPPYPTDPNLVANTTIKQLKAKHTTSGAYDVLSGDIIIAGVVTANDKSGNLYKEIYIQDSTGGIAVELDAYNLSTAYPVGRKVFIKCNGLTLSDYRYLIQLGVKTTLNGTSSLGAIPTGLMADHVFGGSINNPVVPKVVTTTLLKSGASAMQDSLTGALIQLNDFQFANADTSKTYADTSANKSSVNLTVQNCTNQQLLVRTSGFANFAGVKAARGKGNIVGIYTIFNNDKQLIIRDTADVQFKGNRCDGSSPGGGGSNPTPGNLVTISALRAMFTGSNVTLPAGTQIAGTVISDPASKNLAAGNIVLQDATAGIDLYYGSTAPINNFAIGDSVLFDLSGGTLQSYNGLIEVSLGSGQLPTTKIATGKTVVPKVLTIAQLNSQINTIECQLVKIVSATATPAGTYSGSKTLTDASGNIVMYTQAAATFSGSTVPTAASDWVGFCTRFNAPQFVIRNTSDVTAGTGGGGNPNPPTGTGINLTTSPYTIDFNGLASGLPTGVYVKQESTATALGNDASVYSAWAKTAWTQTSLGAKNYASGLSATSSATDQDNATNRALGFRQTGTAGTGGDPGVAFVFQIANTTGKSNLGMSFKLQSLDNSIGRTTGWRVDYGIGDNPTTFTAVTTSPATLTTSPTFANTTVTLSFPAALNNVSSKIWVRVVALDPTTGSGSRPSSAIDDVNFTWN